MNSFHIKENFSVDVPIVKKVYDLYKEFYAFMELLPKKDRYTLGKRCEDAILNFLELIILAASAAKSNKLTILQKANARFDVLKILVRILKETKAIDNRKYVRLQEIIQEIGKMLGGWIKSLN